MEHVTKDGVGRTSSCEKQLRFTVVGVQRQAEELRSWLRRLSAGNANVDDVNLASRQSLAHGSLNIAIHTGARIQLYVQAQGRLPRGSWRGGRESGWTN